ncbi:MAG: serine protease [Nitrospirota bacterium]
MVPTNILHRTFFIRAAEYGTAFAVDVGESQYLVTARHLIPESGSEIELQVLHNGQWLKGQVRVVGRGRGDLDIAVLQASSRFTPKELEVSLGFGEIALGQDVFFLGFPYKLWMDYGELSAGLPGPFVKKGTLSAVSFEFPKTLHVDAINNEGFSGGPLYFFKGGNSQNACVAAIVSKYRTEYATVVNESDTDTGLRVAYNTGFLIAYDIKHALAIIEAAEA